MVGTLEARAGCGNASSHSKKMFQRVRMIHSRVIRPALRRQGKHPQLDATFKLKPDRRNTRVAYGPPPPPSLSSCCGFVLGVTGAYVAVIRMAVNFLDDDGG